MVGAQKEKFCRIREHLSSGSRLSKREISHHSINHPDVAFESRASVMTVMNGGLVFLPLWYKLLLGRKQRIPQTKEGKDPRSRQISTNKWIEGSSLSLHPSRTMAGCSTSKHWQHTLNWTCIFLYQVIKPSVFTPGDSGVKESRKVENHHKQVFISFLSDLLLVSGSLMLLPKDGF